MVQSINEFNSNREKFIQKLQAAGITDAELQKARSAGVESFKSLLASHGIEAPPTPPSGSNNGKDDLATKLEAAGVTKAEFQSAFLQGPDAVRKLMESHGIQPPSGMHSGKKPDKAEMDAFVQKLKAAGITKEAFEAAKAKGPEALNKLLKSHGIEPPSGDKPDMENLQKN